MQNSSPWPPPSPEETEAKRTAAIEAVKELQARRLIRRDLAAFIERFSTEPAPARHHKLLIQALQDAVDGTGPKRLIITMPPGSAKSTYVSQMFSAWFMGQNVHPRRRKVIFASHTQELSEHWSLRARRIVEDDRYGPVMGVGLGQLRGVTRWDMADGGSEFYAVGVGGSPAGRRAQLLILDDPIRSAEEANSETIRQKTWDFYIHDLRPRLLPESITVIVTTRWHHEDIPGRILGEAWDGRSGVFTTAAGETWRVLNIEALSEHLDQDPLGRTRVDESCWPEWWPDDHLKRERLAQGPFMWSALYQGRPTPQAGLYFKREWFKYYDVAPAHLSIYGASDYATKEPEGGDPDYTVHGVIGMDPAGDIYVLDLWREQTTTDVWIETFWDMVKQWQPLAWAQEAGQIVRSVGPFLARRGRERSIDCYRLNYPSVADKPTRARSFQAMMAAGRVHWPRNAPWMAALVSEFLAFDKGKHDDMVDALALVGRMLAGLRPGQVPDAKPKGIIVRPPTFDELIKAQDDDEQRARI